MFNNTPKNSTPNNNKFSTIPDTTRKNNFP